MFLKLISAMEEENFGLNVERFRRNRQGDNAKCLKRSNVKE